MKNWLKILIALAVTICIGGGVWLGFYMPTEKFYIENLIVDIDGGDITEFLGFGEEALIDGGPAKKVLPTFEYYLSPTANIYAPCSGTIESKRWQSNSAADGDWEICITPHRNSGYKIIIDHVTNPTVKKGDKVTVGQIVGNPGTWEMGVGRTELQIKDLRKNANIAPFSVFNPSTKAEYEVKLTTLMEELEGGSVGSFYDWAKMAEFYPGCYFESLPGEDSFSFQVDIMVSICTGVAGGIATWVAIWFVYRKKKLAKISQ